MRCAEQRLCLRLRLVLLALLGGCSHVPVAPPPAPLPPPQRAVPPPAPAPGPRLGANGLPSPRTPRNVVELRQQAAERLVAANPGGTYMGKPQDILLAIPVLQVELNADGTVKRVNVMRKPRQALDTVQLAIDAVHRAEPYGDVSRLPKPWVFIETFLFNDDRRFKPRTLDGG